MKKALKLISIMLVFVMAFDMLAACGTGDAPVSDPPESQTPASQPPESQPPESQPAGEPVVEGDPIDRNEYAIPAQYTKVKVFFGTYGFGDAEIIAAMNDDESAFYIQFVCFDEDQILEGTVNNGICLVTYDLSGFVSMDCQQIYDDTLASEEPWHPLTGEAAPTVDPISRTEYNIPEQYTKVKIFFGSYGFGDAEIIAAMNDDESAFYIQFVCFDEDQILEGTVTNGICLVTYDLSGFVTMACQQIYDDALASEEPWAPLQ